MSESERSSLLSEGRNLIEDEEKQIGNITCSVYWKYLSQSPGPCLNMGALLFAVTPFVLVGYLRLFITSWASLPLSLQQNQNTKIQFIAISVTVVGISGFTAFLVGAVFLHLSNSLHNTMLRGVAHAPMLFFNSNPLGRVITRFSKDTALADSVVTFQVLQWQ